MKPMQMVYTIHAKGEDEAEILIYDEIGESFFGGGVSAEQFSKDLAKVSAKTLNVRINSVGGSVFEGLAIHNALTRFKGKVVTHVDSIAASIASIIALAGQEVRIAKNAFLMIHNPSAVAMGTAEDMRKMADTLDMVAGSLVSVYTDRTGKDEAEIRAWMDEEKWFNAEDAQAAGFVDTITEARKITASLDLSRFRNAPALQAEQPEPSDEAEGAAEEGDVGAVLEELRALFVASTRTLEATRL